MQITDSRFLLRFGGFKSPPPKTSSTNLLQNVLGHVFLYKCFSTPGINYIVHIIKVTVNNVHLYRLITSMFVFAA